MKKHKERMMEIINEECEKFGEDWTYLAGRVNGSYDTCVKKALMHRSINNRSVAFLSPSQQAELLGITQKTINSRIEKAGQVIFEDYGYKRQGLEKVQQIYQKQVR